MCVGEGRERVEGRGVGLVKDVREEGKRFEGQEGNGDPAYFSVNNKSGYLSGEVFIDVVYVAYEKNGPSIEPCGTPLKMIRQLDAFPFRTKRFVSSRTAIVQDALELCQIRGVFLICLIGACENFYETGSGSQERGMNV